MSSEPKTIVEWEQVVKYGVTGMRGEVHALQAKLAAAEAENERLRTLVPCAYMEGVLDCERNRDTPDTQTWSSSGTKQALEDKE